MPLLEVPRRTMVTASIQLDESTAEQVDRYAAFITANADDVVVKALDYVFGKDKDFQDYLRSPDARTALQTLKVKRPSDGAIKHKRGSQKQAKA